MAVDINGIGPGPANIRKTTADKDPSAQNTVQAPAGQADTHNQGTGGDNVSLSHQAKDLEQLEQTLGNYPEMDDNRIAQIRSALESGSYKVDAEKLAQKMLDMDDTIFG